ncbi:glycosyl transferase, partial [Mycobacterium tuberculosis variant pinnipedii]
RTGVSGHAGAVHRYRVLADWDFNIRCFSNPALVTRYMHVVVASYNEFGGLSNTIVDKEFLKRLPMSTRLGIRLVIVLVRRWPKVISRAMVMRTVISWRRRR